MICPRCMKEVKTDQDSEFGYWERGGMEPLIFHEDCLFEAWYNKESYDSFIQT